MNKVYIILTLDYEIFGNGTGDPLTCLINPTDSIIEIADKYNVPITLMFELCEYRAFKNEEEKGSFPDGYAPAKWIEEQLTKFIKSGHDIQLHIHPQWLKYVYHKGKWELDFTRWRVSSLTYEELYNILIKGKQDLEAFLRPYKPDYECYVFRAGDWSIQPEKHVLKALRDAGFKIDTTVAPGCYFSSELTYFDFRDLPARPFWFVKENLKDAEITGILEIPIYTKKYSFFEKIYYKFLKKKVNPPDYTGFTEKRPSRISFKKFFPVYKMLDFCVMGESEMSAILEDAGKRAEKYNIFPVVAIGHSKNFYNSDDFEAFIKNAIHKEYEFVTFRDIIKEIK